MSDIGYTPIGEDDLGDQTSFHTLDYDKPHIYVCTPAYDGKVDSGYAQCMGNTGWHMGLFGIRMTASAMGNSAFIEMGRNLFVKFLLEDENLKSCTHLFFVDSDLEWDSASFLGLVTACNEDRPVVAGVYPRRQAEPWDFPAVWTPHPDIKGPNGVACLTRRTKLPGGDGFRAFRYAEQYEHPREGVFVLEALHEHLSAMPSLAPRLEGRIRFAEH